MRTDGQTDEHEDVNSPVFATVLTCLKGVALEMYVTRLFLQVHKIIAKERNVNKKNAVQELLHSIQPHMFNVTYGCLLYPRS